MSLHNSQLATHNSQLNLTQLFEDFNQLKIIIIGDVMLDSYLWGKVERISPESPVPIVSVHKKEMRLGGAANVAMNVAALGATPILCSVIGNDEPSEKLFLLMEQYNMPTKGLIKSSDRKTTLKTRIISGSHHHLRVDEEINTDITDKESKLLVDAISGFISTKQAHAIIFEDYDKGVITPPLIEQVVRLAHQHSIPVIVDPKKKNFNHYTGVSLFKPNLKELREGMKNDMETVTLDELNKAVDALLLQQNMKAALVTLSDKGIYINYNGTKKIFPAHVRNVADVSGAGDTVVSVAALCEALQVAPEYMAVLCNMAGGIVCGQAGVVPINKQKLLEEFVSS